MESIFEKYKTIPTHFFNYISITTDLWYYLKDNLENENVKTLMFDLDFALKINTNG